MNAEEGLLYEAEVARLAWIAIHREDVIEAGAEIISIALLGKFPDTSIRVRIRDTRASGAVATYTETLPLYEDGVPVGVPQQVASDIAYAMWTHQTGESMRPYDVRPPNKEAR